MPSVDVGTRKRRFLSSPAALSVTAKTTAFYPVVMVLHAVQHIESPTFRRVDRGGV
jgi:hypothetical protein